jgi:CPA1 family monovalent cation:H+ antiporter
MISSFFVILPPLLFQGALHLNYNKLLEHLWVIAPFAIVGVILSTFSIGFMMKQFGGLEPWLLALLFGAMMAPTDPVSVLAIFKEMTVPEALKYLVEGESLFNDGTGVVIFGILLSLLLEGGTFSLSAALIQFVKVSLGGMIFGVILGYLAYLMLRKLDDHLLENAICLTLAYGSFWLAEQVHVSGVIATVMAGLFIGNQGRRLAMAPQTIDTVETFFESLDFLINSLLFILIGLELQTLSRADISANIGPLFVAILALVVSRAIAVYPLYSLTRNLGRRRPMAWAHVMWWGGLRGSIPIALLLSLPSHPMIDPYRPVLLVAGFGTVFFSLVIQGITMKPLLIVLGLNVPEEARSH